MFIGLRGLVASALLPLAAVSAEWPVLKTYDGEFLRRVKMPLGGIGTGTISLAGRGALVDWEIRNRPDKGFTPTTCDAATGFWIRTEDAQGRVSMRLLEGPLDTEYYEGAEGTRVLNHGFPRFRENAFGAAYPLARIDLRDATIPVSARLEAMNPFMPNDVDASSLPAALMRWSIRNETAGPLKVTLVGFLVNPSSGDCSNVVVKSAEFAGVSVGAADVMPVNNELGRVALIVPAGAGGVSTATKIANLGWRIRMDRFWKSVAANARAEDLVDADGRGNLPAAAISVSFNLPARGSHSVPFAIGWRFPHRRAWPNHYNDVAKGAFDRSCDVGNRYAVRFADEVAPAVELLSGLDRYERGTVAFAKGVLDAKAPDVVKEAALFNLSTLRTETCFRTADGHFFGWEGCFDHAGSCFGSCTHVWGYEHALVDLWPELARDMVDLQFTLAMDERGRIANRLYLPLNPTNVVKEVAAADGQMQCIIKAYECWRKTGDDAWMRRIYPRIRIALSFCWTAGGWDADRDGVMEGCQHNTMDVEYYGPNPQMEFLYLAALRATAAMADVCNESEFARTCRDLASKGGTWTEGNLFNGEWYEHKVVPPKGKVANGLSIGSASNLEDPDFQLAAGCLVDQLLGDYAARHVGLGPVADERNANKALDTILARCASDSVGPRYNCGRDYAFPDEPALKMAWYPPGRMPAKPFPYYGENMTGFEYVVAANLAQRGRFAEAERVVRDIRRRYDGKKRNPFDEAECGHHYARALAAWSVMKAFIR